MSTTLESLEIRLNQLAERVEEDSKRGTLARYNLWERIVDLEKTGDIEKLREYVERSHENLGGVIDSLAAKVRVDRATVAGQYSDLCAILGELESVAHDAIVKFGEHSQYSKAIEECAELIDAICHRGSYPMADIAEEAADVFIMAVQVGEMAGTNSFIEALRRKTERLRGLIGGGK